MKNTIINFRWLTAFIFIIGLIYVCYKEGPSATTIPFLVFGLVIGGRALLREPVYVVFTEMSLSIHFLFGFYEEFEWKTIWKIEKIVKRYEPTNYRIYGNVTGRKAAFTTPQIRANKRTQNLIRKYWNSDFEM